MLNVGADEVNEQEAKPYNRLTGPRSQEGEDLLIHEAYFRHAHVSVNDFYLSNSEAMTMFIVNDGAFEGEHEQRDKLAGEGAAKYTSLVVLTNYLAGSRPDIQFTCKELCSNLFEPGVYDWEELKRAGRYFKGRLRLAHR